MFGRRKKSDEEPLETVSLRLSGRIFPSEVMIVQCGPEEMMVSQEMTNRRLFLTEITSISVMQMTKAIIRFNRQDQKKSADERKPILLYISAPDGDEMEAFSLVDVIKLSKTPVHTINLGLWQNASLYVGLAGDWRLALPSAQFVITRPKYEETDSVEFGDELKESGEEASTALVMPSLETAFKRQYHDKVVRGHLMDQSSMTEKGYDVAMSGGLRLLADEAVDFGLIDEVVDDIDDIV